MRDKHIQRKASQTSKSHAKGKPAREVPGRESHFYLPETEPTGSLAGVKGRKPTAKRQATLPKGAEMDTYDPLGRPDGVRQKAIEKLKDYLMARKEELRKYLATDSDLLEDEPTMQGDMVDLAVTTVRTEQSFQRVQAVSQELAKVERAIDRIEKHIYGRCESCDGMIPIARLRALPFAEKCVVCQSAAEANHASLGGDWQDIGDEWQMASGEWGVTSGE